MDRETVFSALGEECEVFHVWAGNGDACYVRWDCGRENGLASVLASKWATAGETALWVPEARDGT